MERYSFPAHAQSSAPRRSSWRVGEWLDRFPLGQHPACIDRDATNTLRCALHALLRHPNPPAMLSPIPLPRLQGRPLLAYPSRLPVSASDAFASCQVVVIFIDPDIYPKPPEIALQTCFGLTLAEARLARLVSSGEELRTVADQLGVTYETARPN